MAVDAPSGLFGGTTKIADAASTYLGSGSIASVNVAAVSGPVVIGDSTLTASNGYLLAAGDSISIDVNNLNKVYLLALVSGYSINFLYTVM